ncbi:DUF4347 domain-containing protein [Amphritea sp. HPY]|uniref:DUF4347 domain-containing protein n=1 Tax=Amphritea sp. HPY TaxID=3421652 RepID=UPI003D7DC0A6
MSKLFGKGKKARKAAKKKQNLQLEALENRVLLSADLGVSMSDLEQTEALTSEVIASELQLETIDPSEFEPQSIAVDDSLTKLVDQLVTTELTTEPEAAEAEPAAEQAVPADAQSSDGQTLTPEALYLMERMQAQQIVILDASIPQLEAVVNELLGQDATDLPETISNLKLQTSDPVLAESPAADTEQNDAAAELIGMTLEQQVLANADRAVKVFVLDAEQDGIEQIGSILDYFEDVAAIHLLSHGSAGALFLGNSKLNSQQLRQNQQQMKRWGEALADDGDLLLYGCDVAEGAVGLEFIDQLAELTGADVAASDDDTGNGSEADWDLEQKTGDIEISSIVSSAMLGTLNFTGTTGSDTITDKTGTVKGLAGNDTYDFSSLPASKVTVTELKNEGSDTLDLSGISEALTITIKKDQVVEVRNAAGTVKITATYVENIIGGSGNDTFYVQKGAELKGYLDGGTGDNTVSYSDPAGILDKNYTGSVNIDFGTNDDRKAKATAIDGFALNGIRNIDIVEGGKKSDFLKGGSGDDELSGAKGDDALSGNAGADTLKGDAGDDWLDGGAGIDTVEGGAGNDTLLASADGDTLKGGSGDDTFQFSATTDWNGTTITEGSNEGSDLLDFSLVTADLTFTLNDVAVTGYAIAATGQSVSAAKYVERIAAGSGTNTFNFKNGWADLLLIEATAAATVNLDFSAVTSDLTITIKTDGSVEIEDPSGHRALIENVDNITGGQGTNTYVIEEGASLTGNLTGGSGTNILDYSQYNTVIDLKTESTPPGITGTLSGDFQIVGSDTQDLLQADTSGQTLSGGEGNDYLLGGTGNDTLSGDKGNDYFTGGTGNDSFIGGKGNDTYYFSDGWGKDTGITEAAKGGTDSISFAGEDAVAATVDIAALDQILAVTSDLTLTIDAGALSVSDGNGANANSLAVAASSFQHIESLLGGSGANTYEFKDNWWQNGLDELSLDDTASTDGTLDFSALTSDLEFLISDDNGVTVITVTALVHSDDDGDYDKSYSVTARGIENLIGGKGDNQYQFAAGASLSGNLTGFSSQGDDSGTATLDFSAYAEGVAIDLSGTASATTIADSSNKLVGGTLSNINDLIGSDHGDTLTGDNNANLLIGGKGNDTLAGKGGGDTYRIGTQWTKLDIDQILGQTDTIIDDSGTNTLDLTAITKDLKLTFSDDGNATDVAVSVALPGGLLSNNINITDTTGSWDIDTGAGDDQVILGKDSALTANLNTGAGDDHIIVARGAVLDGELVTGDGADILDYYSGSNATRTDSYNSAVTVDLSAGSATGFESIAGIRDVYGSDADGQDSLTGDDQDNTFYVGTWGETDGDNSRKHSVTGGDGSDTVSFLNYTASDFAITADLSADTVTYDKAGGTTLTVADIVGIENLTGGAGNDTLIGDALANILNGGAGDDTLQGGDGDDTYTFDSGFGLDSITEQLDEGADRLDFSAVTETLTFSNGRTDATEVDLATALERNVTVTDGTNTLTTGFNVEKLDGVKENDTLEQANVTITTAVQDDILAGLNALKAMVDGLSAGYSEFTDILALQMPLVNSTLADLMQDSSGTAVDFTTVIGTELQTRIDALKTLFWGSTTEPAAADKTSSTTDALLTLKDSDNNPLFRISENTRLLEFATTLELFERTQSLGLDLGGTLSAIPGLDVDLNPDVTTKATFDFAFGVIPTDASEPDTGLEFHVADPALNLSVTLADSAINAALDFGLIAASIDNGSLAMTIDLGLKAEGDLSQQILLDAVDPDNTTTTIDSLFKLATGADTAITADLPITVDAAGLGIDLPSLPTISLSTPALPEFPSLTGLADIFADLDWSLPDLSELMDLSAISMDQLFSMLRSGLSYLVDNFDFDLKIPGLDLSLDDIFKNIPGLDLGLQNFLNSLLDPLNDFDLSLGLQGLADYLNGKLAELLPDFPTLALPQFNFEWDGFDLDIDFDFDLGLNDLLAALSLDPLSLDFDLDLSALTDFLNLPDNFDLDQLGITLDSSAQLFVDAALDIDFELDVAVQEYAKAVLANKGTSGIELLDYAFIGDNTQIAVEASAGAENIDVEASLSISDSLPEIGFWIEDGIAVVQAAAAIALPQVSSGRYQLSGFNVSSFSIDAGGTAALDLPMFLGTGSLPMGGSESDLNGDGIADNVLHAGFDFDTTGLSNQDVIAPDFSGFNLIAFLNDPETILLGLEGMFGGIKTIMADQLGSLGLPFIGDVLKESGAFVDQLRDNMLGEKTGGIYGSGSLGKSLQDAADNGDDVISLIREAMFNELGDYLQVAATDSDGNPLFNELGNILYRDVQSADDIGLVLTSAGELTFNVLLAGSVFEGLDDYVERMGDPDGDGVFDTVIKRFLEAPINFDLSAPGLGLKTGPEDKIEISLDYFFGLGFGLDQSGFFLDTAGVTEAGEELGLTLDASLSDGTKLTGTLGFLQMSLEEIEDDDGNSGLRGKITIDLTDNDDDRWRVGEDLEMAALISADANVDLLATVDMDFDGLDISLPGAFTKIHYDQELANVSWSTGSSFSADFFETPQVVLEDVTLNVGDLFSGFIGPIALELDPFLGKDSELRRVIDILTTEVDLGITKLNLLDIAVLAMNAKSAGTGDTLRTTITALKAVSDFITLAKEAAESNTPILVNFGTFDLGGSLVTSDSSSISNDDLSQSGTQQNSNDAVENSGASASQKKLVTELGTSPGSIMFPILYDPMTAVGLLLGKDVDLFIYDTPDINFLVEYEQSFPIFTGLNAVIKGSLEAYSDFYFGFDTTGIRSWFEKFEKADYDFDAAVSNLDDIFDGFFIADWSVSETGVLQEGDDVAEVTLTVTFAAGAALGIGGLVEAGVLGGIEAEIGLNLHDLPKAGTGGDNQPAAIYDGKIRFDEIATIIQHNPLCLFDMEGAIKAFLEAYLWVGVKVFGSKITLFEASKRFVEVTLATFEWTCPQFPDPEVATIQNGVMTLAYKDDQGNRAAQEQYTVSMEDVDLTDDGIDNEIAMIMVNGNGHTEYFDPNLVNKIVAQGTSGKDIYEIDTSIDADLEIHGGGEDDYIIFTGKQNENRSRKIYGDGGDDTLIGTDMAEYMEGGSGNDNIRSKKGVDEIYGGAGDDFIWAEGDAAGTSGNTNGFANYIDAGDGSDRVLTGDGADKIITGAGDDTVDSGAGADDINTGSGNDYIDAGTGVDSIVAGSGDDGLNWEVGDGGDSFAGGSGTDEIFMAGYQINPEQFYETDTSNYIVDDGKADTITVSDSSGNTNIAWQHGYDAAITLTSSGVETLSMDSGRGADDITIGNLKDTATDSVKVSTGTIRTLKTENRKVKERNDDGDLVDTDQSLDFKILDVKDDNAVDTVRVEGTASADDYLISTVESTGVDGEAQTAIRYEQLDGGEDEAENPTSHVIVDVYDLEGSDKTKLSTLGGNDSINAQGVTQQVVSELFMDGGADNDTIIGSSLAGTSDVIIGGTGSDRITGAVGVDKFYEQSVTGDSNNAGDTDVLVEKRDAYFTLKNQQLVIDDSQLSGQYGNETETFAQIFENAELTGLDSANKFEITDWSGGGILDGGKGGDSYTLELAQLASGRQYLNIDDTGASGIDSLIYKGSAGDDTIQLDTVYKRDEDVEKNFSDSRWTEYGEHGDGLLIAHFDSDDNFSEVDLDDEEALMHVKEASLSAGTDYQVVNYDSVEQVTVFGGEGHDKFISDGSATQIDVFGDGGDDQFYVGSVLKTDTVLVEGQEVTIVEEITDGANFNGSAFFGGEGDDYFEVNHNAADIGLYGDNGDDTFFIKALLTLDDDGELLDIDSGTANVSGVSEEQNDNDTREVDVDTLVYVENANVTIDGGAGFDSVALVGTVLSDTFYVYVEEDEETGETVQRIYGAGVKLQKLLNIERLQLLTGGGDDTVYLYGVDMGLIGDMVVKTGSGSDTVHVGGPEQIINLNFPKNSDLFYSTVEGFKVDQDAEGNYLYAGMVSGMPFYQIDEVGRIVPFEVENPAMTLQVTMPESYAIDAFVSPVLIDGGEGVNDQVIVNNQQGSNRIRFANTELERKDVTFDYDKFSLSSGSSDFVGTMLADATAGAVAQELLASAAGDYIRFQDRYYDTEMVNNLDADQLAQLVIPEGLSYYNIQNTLQSDGSISYARDQLIQLASDFNLTLAWNEVNHPDPTRAATGEKLYELLSIKTASGDSVAFEAQHKETIVFDISGSQNILKDLTALTLKTTSDLTVNFTAGAVTKVELLRKDAMNTLGVLGQAPELHITGINDITLNLSEADADNGSTLIVDNDLFGTATVTDQSGTTQTVSTTDKLYIQGGSEKDDIQLQQTAAEVIVHGNGGDDTITVGKDGRLDQIGDQVYLFGGAGDDTIILDREQDDTDADVTIDKNLLQHSTGFEQLSRITSALSLQNITDAENQLLEDNLKDAAVPYAEDAFAVDSSDLTTAVNEIAEDTLTQLLSVVQQGKTELATSVNDAADLLRENDQQLLENQVKLYTRAKYYDDNNTDDALLNMLTALGLKAQFTVTYKVDIWLFDYTTTETSGQVNLKSGFATAEDWLRNFGNKLDISDGENSQDVTLDMSGQTSLLQQLLENGDGESDLYDLVNDAINKNRQTVFTATENDGDWLDVTFKLELVSSHVHQANDNKVRAYAKIYDTLVNDYIGTQAIYSDLLQARGLTSGEIQTLYNTYNSSEVIQGFNINDPLAGGKSVYSTLVGSVDTANLDLSADILSHRSAAVEAQLNDLDLTRSNSFADQHDDKFDTLISQIQTALDSQDYSQNTLSSISSKLTALLDNSNPYKTGSGLDAAEQMVLAPVYNQLAGNTENGLADLLSAVVTLQGDMSGVNFSTILSQAAAAAGYDDYETLFKTANYDKARAAYSTASELIDSYLIYAAGQPDMENLPTAAVDVLTDIKILDRAADRFDAFVSALESGFDFDSFRTDYLSNQQAVQTFVANNPQYVAYLQSEARYEAMAGSLTQDAKDVITLAALNEQQYNLLSSAYSQAVSDFSSLKTSLAAQYTVRLDYWWFQRTVHLDYTVDYRYVQQKALVERLDTQLSQAQAYYTSSDSQITSLNSLLSDYVGEEDDFETLIAGLGSEYEQKKDALNAQYLVLKELSGFAVDVIKARGPDQDIEGFADDSSLISEMISFYDQYSIIDENADQDPLSRTQFLTEIRDESGELVRETTKSSVIFKEDNRDYTEVTSVTGMTEDGISVHVGYDDVENLTVKTGAGDDQVQVLDTLGLQDAEVHVQTNGGDDEITVSDENDTTEGVTSHLVVEAGTGSNKFDINDIGDNSGDTITMTNSERSGYTSVTGIADGQIHYSGSFGQGVTLQAGIGNDDITIDGVIADAHTTILAGKGDDDITVTSNTTRSGNDSTELTLHGEEGRDVINATESGFAVTIEGNEGDDSIYGSAHNDDISGNDGSDLIIAGLGEDLISGDKGDDIILGDLGELFLDDGVTAWDTRTARLQLAKIESATGGAKDTITGGTGNDTIIGGAGGDEITDNSGNELVFGDHALITYMAGMAAVVASRHSREGGDDIITLTDGDNTILGGSGSDTIRSADGNDIVLGDNGELDYRDSKLVIRSTDSGIGSDDEIILGSGDKTVIAGVGSDDVTITATNISADQRVVLGDEGSVTYSQNIDNAEQLNIASTSTAGGNDVIEINGSHSDDLNIVVAGTNDTQSTDGIDRVTITGNSTDVVLGDNGDIQLTDGELESAVTSFTTEGGEDHISLQDGDKTVIAGISDDQVTINAAVAEANRRIVMGDEGSVTYSEVDGAEQLDIASTSTAGGNDAIEINGSHSADLNVVVAGTNDSGVDSVTITGNSTDVVLGDNGDIQLTDGELDSAATSNSAAGGEDHINLQDGDKTVIAGIGDDQVTINTAAAEANRRIVMGDEGSVSYSENATAGEQLDIASTSTAGGNDTIEINGSNSADLNIAVAGTNSGNGTDSVTVTGNSSDVVLGDNGDIQLTDGELDSAVTSFTTEGGEDHISLQDGDKTVIAGIGNDQVTINATAAEANRRIVMGDEGSVSYSENATAGEQLDIASTSTAGGNDAIEINGSHSDDLSIVVAGTNDTQSTDGIDRVTITGNSSDVVMGDNGDIQLTDGELDSAATSNSAAGGEDHINLQDGDKTVVAGIGDDDVTINATAAEANLRIVMADEGSVTYSDNAGDEQLAIASNSTAGGNDTIEINGSNSDDLNIAVAGTNDGGVDNVTTTGNSTDLVLGDNGAVQLTDGQLDSMLTTGTAEGGVDSINLQDGDKTVVAGIGDDDVTINATAAEANRRIVMADEGSVAYSENATGGEQLNIVSTTIAGGNDTVEINGSNSADLNIAVAGTNSGNGTDSVTVTGNSTDLVLGDNGTVQLTDGQLDTMQTSHTAEGGEDHINLQDGDKTVVAGIGDDDVTINATAAEANRRIVMADEGSVTYSDNAGGEQLDIASTSTAGGNDTIEINGSNSDDLNVAVAGTNDGGVDNVTITGNSTDLVLGDNGTVQLTDGQLDTMQTSHTAEGGEDHINLQDGNKTVIAGIGDDQVTINASADVAQSNRRTVLGDEGSVAYIDVDGAERLNIASTSTAGGNDTFKINGSHSDDLNIVVAGTNDLSSGTGIDSVTVTGNSTDLVLGDNGLLQLTAGQLDFMRSIDSAVGGADHISLQDGDKTVITGIGDDQVTINASKYAAQSDRRTVLGDEGSVAYIDVDGAERLNIASTSTAGGNDAIEINSSHSDDLNIVVAGTNDGGVDEVTVTGDSTDLVLGDNGTLQLTDGRLDRVKTSDTGEGGEDRINLQAGHKTVIAGVGDDSVTITSAVAAATVVAANRRTVLGDEGKVEFADNGTTLTVASTSTEGGNDTITIHGSHTDDHNTVIAGVGNDSIEIDNSSTDIVLGDNGSITSTAGNLNSIVSTNTAAGGIDDIDLGNGDKTVIAGVGADTVDAGAGHHRVIGDNGELTYGDGELALMTSTAADLGGNLGGDDVITLGNGENQIIAGVGNDTITTADGTDHILADNGNLVFDPATQILRSANSVEDTLGGNDTLNLGNAADGETKVVIAGIGADTVTAGNGDHHVLGDHGNLIYQPDGILQQAFNNGTAGDKDSITLNQNGLGNNVVIAGAGDDTVTTGNGDDYVLGDHGELNFSGGIITSGRSTNTTQGGNDTVNLGNGDKLVIGGFGGDTITTGNGDNRVLGDNGELQFTGGILQTIDTQDTTAATGGVDNITLGNGEHIVMGGTHGDTISSGTGDAILIGDNGTATFGIDGKRIQVISELSTLGGDDTITAAGGDNLALGGVGNDTITTGAGADRVFGDNGQLEYKDGILNRVSTTDTSEATGGSDTIEAGDGDNMVFGGTHGDDIDSGIGHSILMGDNGFVQLNDTGDQRVQVVSELSTLGGDDAINASGGNNLAFGSVGNDRIETAAGDDVIFGDNGVADYVDGLADHYYTTDTTMDTSGDDDLIGGAGDDLIFGGLGNEVIYSDAGDDKVVGDLGEAQYNTDDSDPTTLDRVFSKDSDNGGEDEIHGGVGDDVIIGGAKGDKLFGDEGDDFVSGDGGLAIFFNGKLASAETTELFIGGDDELSGGADNDILFGGFGSDLFYGNLNEDAMAGEYARALIDSSAIGFEQGVFVVRLGQGNLDLIAKTQFGLYNDRLTGIGFTPLATLTPLSELGFDTESNTGTYSDSHTRHHASSLGNSSASMGDVLGRMTATAAGESDASTEGGDEQACFNEQGMAVECAVEEQNNGEQATEQSADEAATETSETTQTGEQPVVEEAVEGQPEEQSEELPATEQLEQSAASGAAAAIAAMAGWKVAKGDRSGTVKVAQKGFTELRHQQRRVQRWDDAKQCFVETNEKKSVRSSDWEQAAKNIKQH